MSHEAQSRPSATDRNSRRKVLVITKPYGDSRNITAGVLRLVRGALNWGKRHRWDVLNTHNWRGELPDGVEADGALIFAEQPDDVIEAWHSRVPAGVIVQSPESAESPYAIVRDDHRMIGATAAHYFLGRGFKNCAFCHYGKEDRFSALTEFEELVTQAKGSCASVECQGDSLQEQAESIKRQLSQIPPPMAIFCSNDQLAVRVCRWCLEMGLAVPEQVAILGQGNDPLSCEYNTVPLSSIAQNPEKLGAEAAILLQRMMEGEPTPTDPLLVPVGGVITRRSTDILAIPDADVARALRYIWDHYRENIGIRDIAAAANLSHSKLARHFKASVGRTVIQELTRSASEKACEMLTNSDSPIVQIAAMTGYRSPQYFNAEFKRAFGVTPQKFRRQERSARHLAV